MSDSWRIARDEVAQGTAVKLGTGPGAVCLVRIGEEFYAVGDRCSHANVSLSEGDVDVHERTIACWKHGSAFSLITGQPESLPAVKAVAVHSVTIDGDDVVVEPS